MGAGVIVETAELDVELAETVGMEVLVGPEAELVELGEATVVIPEEAVKASNAECWDAIALIASLYQAEETSADSWLIIKSISALGKAGALIEAFWDAVIVVVTVVGVTEHPWLTKDTSEIVEEPMVEPCEFVAYDRK